MRNFRVTARVIVNVTIDDYYLEDETEAAFERRMKERVDALVEQSHHAVSVYEVSWVECDEIPEHPVV